MGSAMGGDGTDDTLAFGKYFGEGKKKAEYVKTISAAFNF